MALNKQAKILTTKQQELTLGYLERTRYPLRNKIIFMLSYKAGLRAKGIANLTWLMVCNSEGQLKVGILISIWSFSLFAPDFIINVFPPFVMACPTNFNN